MFNNKKAELPERYCRHCGKPMVVTVVGAETYNQPQPPDGMKAPFDYPYDNKTGHRNYLWSLECPEYTGEKKYFWQCHEHDKYHLDKTVSASGNIIIVEV